MVEIVSDFACNCVCFDKSQEFGPTLAIVYHFLIEYDVLYHKHVIKSVTDRSGVVVEHRCFDAAGSNFSLQRGIKANSPRGSGWLVG